MSWKNAKICLSFGKKYILTLTVIYFLEYGILVCWSDRASDEKDGDFWMRNSYAILSLCYQLGVFISRSSLELVKIERYWILTLLQLVNWLVWMYINKGVDLYLEMMLMVWTGLMGGGCYVNIGY